MNTPDDRPRTQEEWISLCFEARRHYRDGGFSVFKTWLETQTDLMASARGQLSCEATSSMFDPPAVCCLP